MGGYVGRIARINLVTRSWTTESTEIYANRFLGGRGVNSWILFNELKPGTKALDPENLLILGAGPLAGTEAPCSAFTSAGAMNVFNNGINYSHAGGYFAPAMKCAGFDHIVVSGRSDRPVYLYLHDGVVEIRDAAHLWGKTTWETQETIRSEIDEEGLEFATIGPAGENLVKGGIIIIDRTRAFGSGGLGAVMGSKRLKAVVARGAGRIPVARPDEFSRATALAFEKIHACESIPAFGEKGAFGNSFRFMSEHGSAPVRNVDDDHWDPAKVARVDYPSIVEGKGNVVRADETYECCFNCPIGCGNTVYEVVKGPHVGLKLNTFEGNTGFAFASRCEVDDPAVLLKVFEQLSLLGLDNDVVGVTISWAMDCFERDLLSIDETDGLDLTWGNGAAVLELVRKIAYREGIGDLLARGVKEAAEILGKGSERFAIHCKGQDNSDGIRAAKGWAFGNVVSLRGGRHLDGAPWTEFQGLSREEGERLYGVSTAGDLTSYEGKGRLTYWYSCFKAMIDSLGICYYTSLWCDPGLLGPGDYAQLVSAALGVNLSADDLMRMGRQVVNVEKAFNSLHCGFSRQDDMPPRIYMEEPIKSGMYKGELLEETGWNQMLDEFYEAHSWDGTTGRQTEETLRWLDLGDVLERLREYGVST